MELRDYIQVYDYTLPNTVCKNVIRLFGSQIHEEVDQKGLPKFRQFNITQAIDDNAVSYTHLTLPTIWQV